MGLSVNPTTFKMLFGEEQPKLFEMITAEMAKAIREDGAEAVFIGIMPGAAWLSLQGIHEIEGAPVVDAFSTAVKMAETMVDLKRAYGTGICRRSIYIPPHPGWEQEIPIEVD